MEYRTRNRKKMKPGIPFHMAFEILGGVYKIVNLLILTRSDMLKVKLSVSPLGSEKGAEAIHWDFIDCVGAGVGCIDVEPKRRRWQATMAALLKEHRF